MLGQRLAGNSGGGGGALVSASVGTVVGAPLTWDSAQWSQGSYITLGGAAGPAGYDIRLPSSATRNIIAQLSGGGATLPIIRTTGTGTAVYFGDATWAQVRMDGTGGRIYLTGAIQYNTASDAAVKAVFEDTSFELGVPQIGYESGSSPYSCHGGVLITLADEDTTLTAAQYKYQFLDIDQTATSATRTVTLPNPSSKARGYLKDIRCFGDATRTITIKAGAGSATADFVSGATGFVTGRVWVEPDIVRLIGTNYAF